MLGTQAAHGHRPLCISILFCGGLYCGVIEVSSLIEPGMSEIIHLYKAIRHLRGDTRQSMQQLILNNTCVSFIFPCMVFRLLLVQVYFSSEWSALLEISFRNFLSGVMRCLPLPAVLRFNTDRRLRLALQQQVNKWLSIYLCA